ncbi:hypothetical protein [Priestia flexa]|uniref:hypothetical protein n=1 Tax=Priestia flexa TaxID=86664 RepID=UPI001CFE4B4A|nr:hypothetical protein [Priestia flexa]
MSLSIWLSNHKVAFSLVPYEDKQYLVCTGNIGFQKVHFVEDLQTGKRAVNHNHAMLESGPDVDRLVIELIKSL